MDKYIKNIMLLLCITFLVYGCSTANVSNEYQLESNNNKGIIFGSISIDEKRTWNKAGISVTIKDGVTGKKHFINLDHQNLLYEKKSPNEFSDPNIRGRVFAIEVDEGTHTFKDWRLVNRIYHYESKDAPQFKVNVKAGEVVYVGNLHFHIDGQGEKFGISLDYGPAMAVIKYQYDRDIAVMKSKYPSLSNNVQIRTLPEGPWVNVELFEKPE